MKEIKIEIHKYVALDGREFVNKKDCIDYEDNLKLLNGILSKPKYLSKEWTSAKDLFIENFDDLEQESKEEEEEMIVVFLDNFIEQHDVLFVPKENKKNLYKYDLSLFWEPVLKNFNEKELWLYDGEHTDEFISVEDLIEQFNEKIDFLKNLKK